MDLRCRAPHRSLAAALALVAGASACSCNKAPSSGLVPACDGAVVPAAELDVGASAFPTVVRAEDALRTDVSTQGLSYPDTYGPRLAGTVARHRVGEVLMLIGFLLRGVTPEASGDYRAQLASRLEGLDKEIASVLAAGGRVHLKLHCSTPRWLATHDFPHSVQTGEDTPSDEPTWACSAPRDLVAWRAIMRGVGAHFLATADRVSFSIGSEPENYFAGTREELIDWYAASVNGLRDAGRFRVGGLTFVGHRETALTHTAPTLNGSKLTFSRVEYPEPVTKTWIERSAAQRLPLDLVTLHQFGGSPVPDEGTFWRRARTDVSGWLTRAGYPAAQVEVLIEDWPQWAPYESNDTEYFAAHVASGVVSMLTLSLRTGAPVRPVQGFLFDFGFRPPGEAPAGFNGRAGFSTEVGIIKPVFNMNSMLAEMEGELTPVTSSSPFVHAVASAGPSHTAVFVTNQVPLEYQVDTLSKVWDQRPIFENHMVEQDLSALTYDPLELVSAFYAGKQPPWPVVIDDFLKDPSPLDLGQLSWPAEIKAQWEERRRVGRLARERRGCATQMLLRLDGLADGTYRLEHFIVDSDRANAWSNRHQLQQRLERAKRGGKDALAKEVLAINREYDLDAGKQPDAEVRLTRPREPISLELQPNSVHLVRLTRQ